MKKYVLYISALLTLLLVTACGGGGGSSTSINTPIPGGSVATTLTLVKDSLAANEATTVSATFTDNGRPLAGMPVTFSVTAGMATLNPANGQVTTNGNGMASIVLTAANTTGAAEITVSALINGTNVTKTSPFFVDTKGLKLSAPTFNPSNSIRGGGSTVVSVNILDASGNLYKDQDVDVYFSANYGGFYGSNSVGKVRSSNGVASATYTFAGATSSALTDTITVNLGSSTVTSYITVNPLSAVNLAYVSAAPNVTTLNYNQLVTFTFRVTDAQGVGIANQAVNFTIGGSAAGSTLQQTSAVSDTFGNVSTTLKAGTAASTMWAVATLASGTQAVASSPVVTVTSQTPASISAGTSASTTLNYGENKLVSFTVTNASGVALPGQVVTFSVVDTTGDVSTRATLASSFVVTNSSGIATANLIAGTNAAIVRVKAVIGGLSAQSANITITSGVPSGLSLTLGTLNVTSWAGTAAAKSLINSAGTSVITARAFDALGQAAPMVLVNFTTTGGAFSGSPSCTTGNDGSCAVTWINSNPVIPTTGVATVSATTSGGASATGTIIMSSASADKTVLDATTCGGAMAVNTAKSCTVTVKDLLNHVMGQGTTVGLGITGLGGTYTISPTTYTVPNSNVSGGIDIPVVITKTGSTVNQNDTVDGLLTITVSSGGVNTVTTKDLKTSIATAPLTVSRSTVTFNATDAANTTQTVTVTGGTGTISVSSSVPAEIGAAIANGVITITKIPAPSATAATATIYLTDSVGGSASIAVNYYKP